MGQAEGPVAPIQGRRRLHRQPDAALLGARQVRHLDLPAQGRHRQQGRRLRVREDPPGLVSSLSPPLRGERVRVRGSRLLRHVSRPSPRPSPRKDGETEPRPRRLMNAPTLSSEFKKQHLIDPEICIRCNTCEATCPVGAVTHDDANYVVDADKCNYCMDCIAPCPTGSIDNWRMVSAPTRLDEQLGWTELPRQEDFGEAAAACGRSHRGRGRRAAGAGARRHRRQAGGAGLGLQGQYVNLFTRGKPAIATVQGNFRITAPGASSDVRHIVLSFRRHRLSRCWRASRSASCRRAPTRRQAARHPPLLDRLRARRREAQRQQCQPDGQARRGRRRLQLPVRSQGRRQGAGDRPVRRHLPDAERSPSQHPDDLHRHRLGALPRLHRAAPPRRARVRPGRLMLFFGARTPRGAALFRPAAESAAVACSTSIWSSRACRASPRSTCRTACAPRRHRIADLLKSGADPRLHLRPEGHGGGRGGCPARTSAATMALDWAALKPHMRAAGRYHVETY